GHRALEAYINNIDSTRSYGGLIQGYHYRSKKFLWICEEHRHEYDCGSNNDSVQPLSPRPLSPQPLSPQSDSNYPLPVPPVQTERSSLKFFWRGQKVNVEDVEAKLLFEPYNEGIVDKLVIKTKVILYDLIQNAGKTKHRRRYRDRIVDFVNDADYYLTTLENRIEIFIEREKKFLAYALERYIGVLLYLLKFLARFNSGKH